MPIDECIKEYEDLGQMVFGRPRPPILNRIQPKFDHKNLTDAIDGVCSRHGEALGQANWGKLDYVTSLKTHDNKDMLCRWCVLITFIVSYIHKRLISMNLWRSSSAVKKGC